MIERKAHHDGMALGRERDGQCAGGTRRPILPSCNTARPRWPRTGFSSVAEELSGFFRRGRVDVEPGPVFKTRLFGQFGDDLDVPMRVRLLRRFERRGVKDEIERRIVQHAVVFSEHELHHGSKRRDFGFLNILKIR